MVKLKFLFYFISPNFVPNIAKDIYNKYTYFTNFIYYFRREMNF